MHISLHNSSENPVSIFHILRTTQLSARTSQLKCVLAYLTDNSIVVHTSLAIIHMRHHHLMFLLVCQEALRKSYPRLLCLPTQGRHLVIPAAQYNLKYLTCRRFERLMTRIAYTVFMNRGYASMRLTYRHHRLVVWSLVLLTQLRARYFRHLRVYPLAVCHCQGLISESLQDLMVEYNFQLRIHQDFLLRTRYKLPLRARHKLRNPASRNLSTVHR